MQRGSMSSLTPGPALPPPPTEEEEEVVEIPQARFAATAFYHVPIERGGFRGIVVGLCKAVVSKERLIKVAYEDGDVEHLTLADFRNSLSAATTLQLPSYVTGLVCKGSKPGESLIETYVEPDRSMG